jgi:predicted RNA-binding protein (virulence factor B family)
MDGVAWLKVISIGRAGAFLDWGVAKDLLVPFSEQDYELEENNFCLVKVYLDEQNRIAASTYLNHYISDSPEVFIDHSFKTKVRFTCNNQ